MINKVLDAEAAHEQEECKEQTLKTAFSATQVTQMTKADVSEVKEKKEEYYDEEYSYSDDDDHIYNEDYNTMLEEVARD